MTLVSGGDDGSKGSSEVIVDGNTKAAGAHIVDTGIGWLTVMSPEEANLSKSWSSIFASWPQVSLDECSLGAPLNRGRWSGRRAYFPLLMGLGNLCRYCSSLVAPLITNNSRVRTSDVFSHPLYTHVLQLHEEVNNQLKTICWSTFQTSQ